MRNFLLRGPAGTGKTEGAKAIAAGLHLLPVPDLLRQYRVFDLLGQILPDVDGKRTALERQWVPPKVEDLRIAGDLARFRAADFQKLETPSSLLFRGRRGTGWEKLQGKLIQKLLGAGPGVPGAVYRLRQMRRFVSGQGHCDDKRPPRYLPRRLHPLLLLPGILPGGRHGGPTHRHCQNLKPSGMNYEKNCIF